MEQFKKIKKIFTPTSTIYKSALSYTYPSGLTITVVSNDPSVKMEELRERLFRNICKSYRITGYEKPIKNKNKTKGKKKVTKKIKFSPVNLVLDNKNFTTSCSF